MASSKPAATIRRASKKPGSSEPEIPRGTWAGVGLVVAALLGAVALAVISPSDPTGNTAAITIPVESADPGGTVIDGRLPTERPQILDPDDGDVIKDIEIDIRVAVTRDPLPPGELMLQILRDGVMVREKKPRQLTEVRFDGIRLRQGTNVLTAALSGPGGLGPLSEPITVVVDQDGPSLEVLAPKINTETFESSVVVSGTSEPGVKVQVNNRSKEWEDATTVGPGGTFEQSVPLVEGKNRIVIVATDTVGNNSKETRVVSKQNGRPSVALSVPKRIKASSLPSELKISADVTDANQQPIPGADVTFTLIQPLRSTETHETVTDDDGRATWRAPIAKRTGGDDVIKIAVKVTAPNGLVREKPAEVEYY
jgi:hypothetical protein